MVLNDMMNIYGSIRIWGSILFSVMGIVAVILGREVSTLLPTLILFFVVILLITGLNERKENNLSSARTHFLASTFNIIVASYIYFTIF